MFRMTLVALALAAGPVAAETMDAAAIGIGMSDNEVTQVAENHIIMKTESLYEAFDTEGPFAGASGECFGAAEMKDGAVTGSGICVFDVENGETAVVDWQMNGLGEDGATTGEWTVTGGNGAWATASGGGAFSNLTDPETGEFENNITGEVTFE